MSKQRAGAGPKCEEPGCELEGFTCSLNDDEDTEFCYCNAHARKNGFCMSCGNFCAGIESFDFTEPRGFCDNCRSELEEDIEDEEIAAELSEFEQEDLS